MDIGLWPSYCLKAETNVDPENKYKQTWLSLAAKNGREAVTKLLLENRANVDLKDRYDQRH